MLHRIGAKIGRRWGGAILAAVAWLGTIGPAAAQFRVLPYPGGYAPAPTPYAIPGYGRGYLPYAPPAYSPNGPAGYSPNYANSYPPGMGYAAPPFNPYGYPANPFGGYFSGGVSANTAKGGLLIDTQQANLMNEQVKSAQMTNRRQAYEEYLYEKSLTDNLNDQQVAQQQEELRQALASMPLTDVWSGKAMNTLIAHIQALNIQGVQVPDLPLVPDTLRQINVALKGAGAGLLKKTGKLTWPLALQTLQPEPQGRGLREQIDALLLECKKQALAAGHVDPGTTASLGDAIGKLRTLLIGQLNEYSFTDFTKGKDYLGQLDRVVQVFQQPDAANYVNGKYQARGGTVTQLARYMAEGQLRFAPSSSGEEGAYSALYQALVQYDLAASTQVAQQQAPPLLPQPKFPG